MTKRIKIIVVTGDIHFDNVDDHVESRLMYAANFVIMINHDALHYKVFKNRIDGVSYVKSMPSFQDDIERFNAYNNNEVHGRVWHESDISL